MKASTLYLMAALAGAANTVNARRPFARSGPLSVGSFASGWVTSEAVVPVIAAQACLTGVFAARGAFKRPAGWLGLGITAASWAALITEQRRSEAAGQVLEHGLTEGLGDNYRSEISDEEAPLGVLDKYVPGVGSRSNLFATDIAYGDAGARNLLDIWRSPNLSTDAKAPVLVQVHGGGWIIGNKREQARPLMSLMADHGWVCVSINYRLSPRATWPDHIVDVKRAIAWVKDNIADFGGDPDFVAITGGSAGGHLSSLAALTPNEAMFQPGFEDADTSVVAAVPFYGVYDFLNRDGTGRDDMLEMLEDRVFKSKRDVETEVWEKASTMTWVREDAPPFFVIHGSNDSLVPVEQARSFVETLSAKSSSPVIFVELPGAQHAFDIFRSARTSHTIRAVARFLETVRKRAGHGSVSHAA
ncbi:MAG: alpha/beta hydrolase [Acidobacteria bacterium]|nr:alpha/beta hydrolase [Acidobacteriota bacterium]